MGFMKDKHAEIRKALDAGEIEKAADLTAYAISESGLSIEDGMDALGAEARKWNAKNNRSN